MDTGNAMAAKALYYSLCWAPALAEPGTDEYLVQKSEVTKLFREDLTYLTVKNPHSIMPSIYPIYLARYMMSEASIPIVHANLKVNVDGETGAVFHHFTRRYGKIILAS